MDDLEFRLRQFQDHRPAQSFDHLHEMTSWPLTWLSSSSRLHPRADRASVAHHPIGARFEVVFPATSATPSEGLRTYAPEGDVTVHFRPAADFTPRDVAWDGDDQGPRFFACAERKIRCAPERVLEGVRQAQGESVVPASPDLHWRRRSGNGRRRRVSACRHGNQYERYRRQPRAHDSPGAFARCFAALRGGRNGPRPAAHKKSPAFGGAPSAGLGPKSNESPSGAWRRWPCRSRRGRWR